MSEMGLTICNKCYAPMYRGKRPYYITQCGHIFCQSCTQQVEKQCPQCQRVGSMTLALEEPLMPKLMPYFQPFVETLEMMLKVDSFRHNQIKIMMQRFYELDKKYEVLKTRYWMARRHLKTLMEKYMNLKNEMEKREKKWLVSQMQHRGNRMVVETPTDSGISTLSSIAGYSVGLSDRESANITPMQYVDLRRQYKTVDGFLVPIDRKRPKIDGSFDMLS